MSLGQGAQLPPSWPLDPLASLAKIAAGLPAFRGAGLCHDCRDQVVFLRIRGPNRHRHNSCSTQRTSPQSQVEASIHLKPSNYQYISL